MRPMRRFRQELTAEECVQVLERGTHGVLAVLGDEGYPYAVPLSYVHGEGKLWFHCAKAGHKLDAIRNYNKVSFCVYDEGTKTDGEWALTIRSVIVFGTMEVIGDADVITDISARLSRKFTDDEAYIKNEIECFACETLILRLKTGHMCGKRIVEK